MEQEKIIYSKRLALELRKRGFEIVRTGVNENFPQFNTYIFKFTPELDEAINQINSQS